MILEQVERANLFLLPLDTERQWFRYHRLFADALHSLLKSDKTFSLNELHRRAAEWYEANHMFTDAIGHALLAEDWELAAVLMEEVSLPVATRAKAQTILDWIGCLPVPVLFSHPRLRIRKALSLMFLKRFDEFAQSLGAVESDLETHVGLSIQDVHSLLAEAAIVRSILFRFLGDIPACVASAGRALDLVTPSDILFKSSAQPNAALGFLVSGDMRSDAEKLLLDSNYLLEAPDFHYVTIRGLRLLGWFYALKGSLRKAAATFEEVSHSINNPREFASVFGSTGYYFGMADLLLEWNDLDAAEKQLEMGIKVTEELHAVDADNLSLGYQTLARLKLARGDLDGALETLRTFETFARKYGFFSPLIDSCIARQVRIGLLSDNTPLVNDWLVGSALSTKDAPCFPRETGQLLLARVMIARGQTSPALFLLDRLLQDATTKERHRSVIGMLILRALAFRASGEQEQAIHAINSALSLAEPENYLRIFVDEGQVMVDLLEQAAARGCTPAYVKRILNAFDSDRGMHSGSHGSQELEFTGLITPISKRESEILRLIASGASNQVIADELVISIATVKRHLSNIYAKLQVTSRTQAVAKGRDLGLL